MYHRGQRFTSFVESLGIQSLNLPVPQSQAFSTPLIEAHTHIKTLCSHIMYGTMAGLKWIKPQALPFNVSDGIIWLTVTVIPSTKVNSVRVRHTYYETYVKCRWNHNLWVSWSPLKSALRDRVRVKVRFTGNACFRHVLFKLLMYIMFTGVYGSSGSTQGLFSFHYLSRVLAGPLEVIQQLEKYLIVDGLYPRSTNCLLFRSICVCTFIS